MKSSRFYQWKNKESGNFGDPFLSEIFEFLSMYPETQNDYYKILAKGTSHTRFCKGILRDDGYYPLRNINEKIYYLLCDAVTLQFSPDDSSVIQDIANGYLRLSNDFRMELKPDSPVFHELITLENCYGIQAVSEYLDRLIHSGQLYTALAWLTIIAIFPAPQNISDKKPDYTQMLLKTIFQYHTSEQNKNVAVSLHNSMDKFIENMLKTDDTIDEINLAFNHGVRWLVDINRNTLLCKMIEHTKHINILITEPGIAEAFTKHLRRQEFCYVSSYIPPQKMWEYFCKKFPGKITLKVSHIPAMRQYCEFHFHHEEYSALFVGFYTYGGLSFDHNNFLLLKSNDTYYHLYQHEFHYLWTLADDLSIKLP
ncbi:MAG: hypothetical protein K2H29_09800 [Oscillospiraceae bacterium]|nr:hypothetical protein [Oscillospiraceae bacterium]